MVERVVDPFMPICAAFSSAIPTPARGNTPIQKRGWYEVDKHFIMISGCRKWRVCAVCAVVCSGSVRRWTAETDWRNLPSSCARTLLVAGLPVAPSVLRVWWWAQKSACASGREVRNRCASHALLAAKVISRMPGSDCGFTSGCGASGPFWRLR